MSEKEIRPIDANATIEKLQANFQQGSWYGCEEPCYQIAKDTISEMPTIYAAPSGDPLTLEQLREMDGKPVWVEFEDGSGGLWGIVHISAFEQIVFPDGLHCTIGHPYYGKTYKAYAYPLANIDREAWTAEWQEYTGADAGFHYCSKCKQQAFNYEDGGEVVEVLSDFCPECARAMTQKARNILEKRFMGE